MPSVSNLAQKSSDGGTDEPESVNVESLDGPIASTDQDAIPSADTKRDEDV